MMVKLNWVHLIGLGAAQRLMEPISGCVSVGRDSVTLGTASGPCVSSLTSSSALLPGLHGLTSFALPHSSSIMFLH